jgi:hypothetical protein
VWRTSPARAAANTVAIVRFMGRVGCCCLSCARAGCALQPVPFRHCVACRRWASRAKWSLCRALSWRGIALVGPGWNCRMAGCGRTGAVGGAEGLGRRRTAPGWLA